MGTDQLTEENHKKGRQRKKALFNGILQQMEFYFGDSNLSKDRFLGQLLQENEYIDLDVFLTFNKIRKLTTNIADIAKALKSSELIELSEDSTKIKRKKPIAVKSDVEACTIYVENLKSDTTHEWLIEIFSKFGKVAYVSIPKYKQNRLNKGFAFVEFDTPDDAKKTIEFFESIGSKISLQISPEDLISIKTFEDDNGTTKRKHEDDGEEEEVEKKQKIESDETNQTNTENDDNEENDKKRKLDEDIDEHVEKKIKIKDESETDEVKLDKKELKKLKKRKAQMKELGLQVLAKIEWKKMRNRYLEMQKKKMKQLKLHLNKKRFNLKYEEKNELKEAKAVDNKPKPENDEIEIGLIVKIKYPKVITEVKKIKAELKNSHTDIKFIEIPVTVNNDQVFVRFGNKESAKEFCESSTKGECAVLEGEEEKVYWQKVKENREVKHKKEHKKQRGRDKLLKKAEKKLSQHIRFDHDD